jgi:hypothetical protein
MMRGLALILALVALFTIPATAAFAQQRVEVNAIIELEFEPGEPRRVRFELDAAAALHFDVFAGTDSIGAVLLQAETGNAAEADKRPAAPFLVLGPGRHTVDLVANGPDAEAAGRIQGRLTAQAPNDAFEPNDTVETAARISLPFHRVVRLSDGDWDWFRIDPPRAGVLGVQMRAWRSAYQGPVIRILDADGEELYASPEGDGAWNGMRYVRVGRDPVFVGVSDTRAWRDNQTDGYKALEIVMIQPLDRMRGQLVSLGLDAGDPGWLQLQEIGAGLGTELRAANEAEAVATELSRAVAGSSQGGGLWLYGLAVLVLLIAAAGGVWLWRRRGQAQTQPKDGPPD